MNCRLQNMIDVRLYSEIVSGKLHPSLTKFKNEKNLSKLIIDSQIQKILINNDNGLGEDFIRDFDFNNYGFKSSEDFRIKKTMKKTQSQIEFTINPTKVYTLQEDYDIPIYLSNKVNTFIALIVDEFERIKTRAERKHDLLTSEKHLNFYCKKNIQKIKKIFHDAKNCLDKFKEKENLEDFFIIFILSQFLIRTILFFQKHFKHFIDFRLDNDQELYGELYAKAFYGNQEFIFKFGLMGFSEHKKRSQENEKGRNIFENEPATFLNESKSECNHCKHIIKVGWFGQINILIDSLEQVFCSPHTNEIRGSKVVRDLIQAIICIYISKKGIEPMSPSSIRTTTNIDRIDKRLKEGSPKRLHISFKKQ